MPCSPGRMLLLLLLLVVPHLCAQGTAAHAPQLTEHTRYALRAGDVLTLDYRYTPEFNQTVTIQPDGFVTLNLVGDLVAAGLTVTDLHERILAKAQARLKEPEVTITLKEFEKPYFVVAGEVDHPGRFDFYEKTTALQAVLLSGGFKGTAQQSDVYLFRKVHGDLVEVHKLNLKKVHSSRDLERDMVLEPGDMLLVPRNKLENISRFMKATNLAVYFDPLTYTHP